MDLRLWAYKIEAHSQIRTRFLLLFNNPTSSSVKLNNIIIKNFQKIFFCLNFIYLKLS